MTSGPVPGPQASREQRDLPHRDADWPTIAARIGWLTFDDCEELNPGSCRWLTTPD